jgi:hypothetical protein
MAQESFRAWQGRAIDQKQSASAMMLGLSGGALAFSVSLLSGHNTYIGCIASGLFQVDAVAQLLSIAAGVAFSLNRVGDFDLTSQIARARERDPTSLVLKDMRAKVRRRGRITRRLYLLQGVAFVVGALAFVAFVTVKYRNVLFP